MKEKKCRKYTEEFKLELLESSGESTAQIEQVRIEVHSYPPHEQ